MIGFLEFKIVHLPLLERKTSHSQLRACSKKLKILFCKLYISKEKPSKTGMIQPRIGSYLRTQGFVFKYLGARDNWRSNAQSIFYYFIFNLWIRTY